MPNSKQQLERRALAGAGREARCILPQCRGLTKFIPDTNQQPGSLLLSLGHHSHLPESQNLPKGADQDRSKGLAQGKGHADQHFTEGTRMGLLPSGSSKEPT